MVHAADRMQGATMPQLLAGLWRHLRPRRRRQLLALTLLMLVSALAEIISLGAVLPFIGVLASPDIVFRHPWVANIARTWGITSGAQLVLPLTVLFAVAAVTAGAVRIVLLWATSRLTFASGAELSTEIYRRTLCQPYPVHIGRSSNEIISGITNKVGGTVLGVLLPALTLVSSAILLLALMLTLLAINPTVALAAVGCFGSGYAAVSWRVRRRLRRNSEYIARESTKVVKALQEGLGGIRDVLLDGTQPVYCEIYRQADKPLRKAIGDNVFLSQSPRFAMESLGMVLIGLLAYVLSRQSGGLAAALPVLGALALGAQRLLPALQQGYAAWANIAGSRASLADTIALLDQPIPEELLQPMPPPLTFREAIQFRAVRFRYAADGPWVLDNFNLTIPKGSRVGLVGSTGSGKSTALDLLMGLLRPTEGEVRVDGETIGGPRVRAWQQIIAHVPQSIYLAEATFAENIAFGVPCAAIDYPRVRHAARQAQIADFIETQPKGYETSVGERGVRLSGGQRQRIGIARALYKQAQVLILDEATSALDNLTEQSVMAAIEALDRELTILLIAHRLTSVRRLDSIVELERGRVIGQGRYEDLLERSDSFRRMAQSIPVAQPT